jgi:hypothetical protein
MDESLPPRLLHQMATAGTAAYEQVQADVPANSEAMKCVLAQFQSQHQRTCSEAMRVAEVISTSMKSVAADPSQVFTLFSSQNPKEICHKFCITCRIRPPRGHFVARHLSGGAEPAWQGRVLRSARHGRARRHMRHAVRAALLCELLT